MKKQFALGLMVVLLAPLALLALAEEKSEYKVKTDLPLRLHLDFAEGEKALEKLQFNDRNAWELKKDGDTTILSQNKQSKYKPKVRSPLNIAWIKDVKTTAPFVIDVKVRSTNKRNPGHRDVCIAFGKTDEFKFLYAHCGKVADGSSHCIHIVNDKPRENVTTERTDGVKWDDEWHHVRIERAANGHVDVYFDDAKVLQTDNAEFLTGGFGFGTFDDTADFAEVKIWGAGASS